MKIYCILLLVSAPFFVWSQQDIRVFCENKDRGYILYASNSTLCPLTVSLDLTMENLNFSGNGQKYFVIPEKTIRMKLGEFDLIKRSEKYNLSFRYRSYFGNVNLNKYDTGYAYNLPYEKGKSILVSQGYNGQFSHQHINALDFSMPEGTPVYAARDGVVIQAIQDNTKSCPTEDCKGFANYITIYHADGTFGQYAHLRYNGAMVNVGDSIKQGDLIAYSGNTGWSTGPHLHFMCLLPPLWENERAIATKFKINDGIVTSYLEEKQTYRKDY